MSAPDESLASKLAIVFPHLNERQCRIVAAAEARAMGRGGIVRVAEATGMSRSTVQKAVHELDEGLEVSDRVRRPGGGRRSIRQTNPRLVKDLEAMVEPATRGDPESPLRWTSKSTRQLAAALAEKGHDISHSTVADILHELGYNLQANVKSRELSSHPDRDAQFRYLTDQVQEHMARKQPVISVDTKKKELVGDYKNAGREWEKKGQPVKVNIYDFVDPERGKAIPYSVYDVASNAGWVSVGTDHDTASFAVETIRRWWLEVGRRAYPKAKKLLISADGGGSNGYRTRLWKIELSRLAAETGLSITVCHLPPGTSKWNKIEHRLFSHISMNWRGRPLTSHEVVVELIGATTTRAGLKVRAQLDTNKYPTDIKVTDEEIAAVPLRKHDFHGEWNYTIHKPRASRNR